MGKIPLITIVGVPNTGKSTLFNRLIGKRKALIHSAPGMTRDIYKENFYINRKKFNIQDSGGFFVGKDVITGEINKRIFKEAKISDLIIFIFDGKRELLGYEKDLYLDIKRINPDIIPVINKVDNPDQFILPTSYYALKLDFFHISADHNIGMDDLIDCIEKKFKDYTVTDDKTDKTRTRISIVGKPNVGKSSIINKILNDDFVIVSHIPGTTRDSVDLKIKRKNHTFVLVDNAGIRKLKKVKEGTESAAVIRAEKDIRYADIIIFVIDVSSKIDQNDMLIAHKILKSAKPVIIAGNKWDLIENKDISQSIIKKIKKRLGLIYFAPLIITSAQTGKNIFKLIDRAELINSLFHEKIKTSYLNKIIQNILKERKLITVNNRTFNPKYISIESYRPLFIKFYCGFQFRLKTSDEKYLKRRIMEELGFEGVPVFFKVLSKSKK